MAADSVERKLWSLIRPHALSIVCDAVEEEMDVITKEEVLPGLSAVSPEFIKLWAIADVSNQAPFLMQVLCRAAQTSRANENNRKKHPNAMCNIMVKQLSYHRSGCALGFPAQFGLFLWTSGCSQQTIDSLHRCGLSVSYLSVLNNLAALADHCINVAISIRSGIHVFCYDNVQISTSIFVEQRGSSGPAKLTSGTFGVLYKVCNGNPEHMQLAPILEQFKVVKGLKYNCDVHPTHQQHKLFYLQLRVAVVRVLLKYCPVFQSYAKDPTLQNLPHRLMPPGYEATVNGNLLYHDDIYLNQLGQTHEDLLAYFFALIEKTHLKGEHPHYHTLLSALMQILDSIVLNAWRHESGHTNLGEFASTEPLAEDLLSMAGDIIDKHATPLEMPNTLKKQAPAVDNDDSNQSDAGNSLVTTSLPDPDRDTSTRPS
ncbi:hypothetical protein EI94DRAFT_1774626 [Lactarius quietus]|nr:hypothetical protein EI94DRAFT_1774626 [Lactarius quietus]